MAASCPAGPRSRAEARPPEAGGILRSVSVSVPGKLILAGEHAVVYGRPALVAALDLRLRVTLEAGDESAPPEPSGVVLDLPGIGYHATTTWPDLLAYARGVRERWERYTASPTPDGFRELRGEDPAHVVKIALGEASAWLASQAEAPPLPPACRLRVDSEIPVGSGFGSSAATALGILGAVFAAAGLPLDAPEIESLALEVERRQHGTPSGVDGAAALHGGLLWAQRRPEGGLATERLAGNPGLLSRFRVYHTGTPPEPTGAVVAAVRQDLERSPDRVGRRLDLIEAATRTLRSEVEGRGAAEAGGAPSAEALGRVLEAVRACQRALEGLGVVPAPVQELVARIEAEGGAAKISGAGSLAGPGAGSLLVFHPDSEAPGSWSFLSPLPCYAVRLGAEGLRRERGS